MGVCLWPIPHLLCMFAPCVSAGAGVLHERPAAADSLAAAQECVQALLSRRGGTELLLSEQPRCADATGSVVYCYHRCLRFWYIRWQQRRSVCRHY
jgi:hypothetical protein